jgi:hypothetical protein
MSQLDAKKRAKLPNSAFAYVDSQGRKRLPINDESHVRNALARFNQVVFEDEAARERARKRLLGAAKKYGIVPIGFMTGQLESRTSEATAGRLVIELGQVGTPGEFEQRLRSALRDPTLTLLHWSDSAGGYLDGTGQLAALPDTARQAGSDSGTGRAVTLLERQGQPMTALVHDPAVLKKPDLVKTVVAALRLAVENDRLRGQVEAQASEVRTLPGGSVTFLLTDIEGSTGLLQRLGTATPRCWPTSAPSSGVACTGPAAARSTHARTSSLPSSFVPRRRWRLPWRSNAACARAPGPMA